MTMGTAVSSPELRALDEAVANRPIREYVSAAVERVVPYWPLPRFISRSPFVGYEHLHFDYAATTAIPRHFGVNILPKPEIARAALYAGRISSAALRRAVENAVGRRRPPPGVHDPVDFAMYRLLEEAAVPALQDDVAAQVDRIAAEIAPEFTDSPDGVISSTYPDPEGENRLHRLNRHMATLCMAYYGNQFSHWFMPDGDEPFFEAWRRLIPYDPDLGKAARRHRDLLEGDAGACLERSLHRLGVPPIHWAEYLLLHLTAMPGWSSYVKWEDQERMDEALTHTLDYLAARVTAEMLLLSGEGSGEALWTHALTHWRHAQQVDHLERSRKAVSAWLRYLHQGTAPVRSLDADTLTALLEWENVIGDDTQGILWLNAWEMSRHGPLLDQLSGAGRRHSLQRHMLQPATNALAQVVLCIDVRSEPFSRQLEAVGPYETFGYAGFFGLPIAVKLIDSDQATPSCPAIMPATYTVVEKVGPDDKPQAGRYLRHYFAMETLKKLNASNKSDAIASFAWAEWMGPWRGVSSAVQTYLPHRMQRMVNYLTRLWASRRAPTTPDFDQDATHGIPMAEQVQIALNGLRSIGLVENFAPLVVFCGHGSQSRNNPFAAKLDCGACGGRAGGFNAQVIAQVCNKEAVREGLRAHGIDIPPTTRFIAAQHNTTTDELEWLDAAPTEGPAGEAFDRLCRDIPVAARRARRLRLSRLPGHELLTHKYSRREALRRANDWSETYPEWGLSGNMALVIGPRAWTRDIDLGGQVFLHAYRYELDRDGQLLDNLLAGPLLVAQWINMQYYASTVQPAIFGSGSKVTQSLVGHIGLVQGNGSDLLTGLPHQSVMRAPDEPQHEPLRLMVAVYAPREHVQRSLDRLPEVAEKIRNAWLHIAVCEPDDGLMWRLEYSPSGTRRWRRMVEFPSAVGEHLSG